MKDQNIVNDIRQSVETIKNADIGHIPVEAQDLLNRIAIECKQIMDYYSPEAIAEREAQYQREQEFYRRSIAAKIGWEKRRAREIAEWWEAYQKKSY